jgi:Fic family protein
VALNWIHPFVDGNGRTSRVASYLVLCARLGYRLPGTKTIPERIAENKKPYYAALEHADVAWKQDRVDVSEMEKLLQGHLEAQLADIRLQALSGHRDDVD